MASLRRCPPEWRDSICALTSEEDCYDWLRAWLKSQLECDWTEANIISQADETAIGIIISYAPVGRLGEAIDRYLMPDDALKACLRQWQTVRATQQGEAWTRSHFKLYKDNRYRVRASVATPFWANRFARR